MNPSWTGRSPPGSPSTPHQEESLLEIVAGANVIVGTPTGSGKSPGRHGRAVHRAGHRPRAYYTAPIKALVSEKFFDLVDIFGAGRRRHDHRRLRRQRRARRSSAAPRRSWPGSRCAAAPIPTPGIVVMDEFHYYGDPQRGWAWQVPLLELPRAQFVLMSATLGDMRFFADDLTERTGRETAVIADVRTPCPAALLVHLVPLTETLQDLLATNRAPVYIVHFTQAAAAGTGAGAVQPDGRQPGRAGPDRRGDRRFPVLPGLRPHPVPAGPARHRRAPRRDAAQVPAAGGEARPVRAAQGDLRDRHPRRRHQRADPHRADDGAVASTTAAAPGCCPPGSSTRSPAGPAGPGSTSPVTSWCSAPEHVIENAAGRGQGRRRRRQEAKGGAPQAAGGLRQLVGDHLRQARRRRTGTADLALPGVARHGARRGLPARATRSRPCAG